jgi:hypothetical protein
MENDELTAPFSLEEIHKAVVDSDGNKCPGPDGFNNAFFKNSWDLLKGEIRILFDQFHGIGSLPSSMLSYFVTLIPKVNSPFSLGDFRPISLLGSLYKLIAKVLASRLAKVMNTLIAPTQSAFIKGRNLVDGVLVTNELVDLARRQRRQCLIFKVDFEKAYDSVDWGYLEYMLWRFGFCEVWIGWIRACVFGGNLSVLVNGSPTREIQIQRGLKQGDPLAPFLFLLVAEGFGGAMKRAGDLGMFKGFNIGGDGPLISHLQYADDTLCIGEASVENLWSLKAILRGFERASGLKVNFWKSSLMGVNVDNEFMEMASNFLNCIRGGIPFKYLGLPVGASPRKLSTWAPKVEKIRSRLNSWGNKHISFSGRLVLINSVLNSIPIFYMSLMRMPVQVRKKVIKIQRDFLWGGVNGNKKLSWVKWKVVCREKKKGGLGVRDLEVVNKSLLLKWRWRLVNDEGPSLWKEVLAAKYGTHILNNVNLSCESSPYFASLWWKDVCNIDVGLGSSNWLEEVLVRRLGNGMHTRFWKDVWIGDGPLSLKFPRLFSLSMQKDICVGALLDVADGRWDFIWRRNLFQWESESVTLLLGILVDVNLSGSHDAWVWKPNPEDGFSVKSAHDSLVELGDSTNLSEWELKIFSNIWESPAPSKVIVFSWQLLYDRLPTKDNLLSRGVLNQTSDTNCVWCGETMESAKHLFLHCHKIIRVWYEVCKWLGVLIIMPPDIMTLFDCLCGAVRNKKKKKGFLLVWHTVMWVIWRARNDVIFNGILKDPLELVEEIKVLSWKWSVDCLKINPCLFYEWCWDPGDCFKR